MNGDYHVGQLRPDLRTQDVNDQPEIRQGEDTNSPNREKQTKFGTRTCSANQPEADNVLNGRHSSPAATPYLHCPSAHSSLAHRLPAGEGTGEVPEVGGLLMQNLAAQASNPDIHYTALEIFNRLQDKHYRWHRIGSRYSLEDVRCAMSKMIVRPEATLDSVTGKVLAQCLILAPSTNGTAKAGSSSGNPRCPHPTDDTKPAAPKLPANASRTSEVRQQIPAVGGSRPKPVNGASPLVSGIKAPITRLADLPSHSVQQGRPEDEKKTLFIRSGLRSLGIAEDKVDKIMSLQPLSMEEQKLCRALKYDVQLTDDELATVLQYLESCGQVNHEVDTRGSVTQGQHCEKTQQLELDATAEKKKREVIKEQQIHVIAKRLIRGGFLNDPVDKIKEVLIQLPIPIYTLQGAARGDEYCLSQILSDYAEFKPSGRVPCHSVCYNSSESGILVSDPDFSSQSVNVGESSGSDIAPGQNPWVMEPGLSASSGVNPQAPAVITRTHGGVTLRVRAGIQARNNNCCLAAFFVSFSHNGLFRKLIEDAESRVEMLRASGQPEQSLTDLIAILKTFDIGDDREKFIPNDGLDQIRFRYGLRSVEFKPDAMSELTQEHIGDFAVGSAFKGGDLLCFDNQQAVISLKNITDSPSLVEVISLPDHALGYMRVNGMNLTIGQRLTHADLCGLKFVPLGEVLEPVEFIPPILNEIYGCWSDGASSEQSPTASLKRNMSLIEVQNDRKLRNVRTVPSRNFSTKIEDEVIPGDYVLDEKRLFREPHPFHRDVLRNVTEYYCKNGVVMLKLTKELDFKDQSVERKIFQYFTAQGKLDKKIAVHYKQQDQTFSFISAKHSEFINAQGQTIIVDQHLYGYCKDEPTSGSLKTTVMQRAGSVEDFIQIYNDSLSDFSPDNACAPKEVPVTDKTCPDVLFVTVPNFGRQNRCDLKWLKGANIGQASYEVSAVVAIEGSHYVSWRNDPDNGQMHFADSMADISHDIGTVPVVVTMPNHNTDVALQTAHEVIGGDNDYIRNAKDKLGVLGKELALFILKRVS